MIELGYVLTYRAAWPVSLASVIVNGMVAALLVPIGVWLFGEHLSPARILGLLLCLAGVWLLQALVRHSPFSYSLFAIAKSEPRALSVSRTPIACRPS